MDGSRRSTGLAYCKRYYSAILLLQCVHTSILYNCHVHLYIPRPCHACIQTSRTGTIDHMLRLHPMSAEDPSFTRPLVPFDCGAMGGCGPGIKRVPVRYMYDIYIHIHIDIQLILIQCKNTPLYSHITLQLIIYIHTHAYTHTHTYTDRVPLT